MFDDELNVLTGGLWAYFFPEEPQDTFLHDEFVKAFPELRTLQDDIKIKI